MTQVEIFNSEKSNFNRIILYKEGLFWRAYEKSAYAFIHQIHSYSPIQKFIKIVGDNVVNIGFPISAFDKFKDKVSIEQESEKQLIISSKPIDNNSFLEWKNSVEFKIKLIKPEECSHIVEPPQPTIENMIRRFSVENKSPLECMMFVVDLKKILNGSL